MENKEEYIVTDVNEETMTNEEMKELLKSDITFCESGVKEWWKKNSGAILALSITFLGGWALLILNKDLKLAFISLASLLGF